MALPRNSAEDLGKSLGAIGCQFADPTLGVAQCLLSSRCTVHHVAAHAAHSSARWIVRAQVETNPDGGVKVDDGMMTSVDGVYGIGDIRNTPQNQLPCPRRGQYNRRPKGDAAAQHASCRTSDFSGPQTSSARRLCESSHQLAIDSGCRFKQVVVAASDGCIAAMSIDKFLKKRKNVRVDWIHK